MTPNKVLGIQGFFALPDNFDGSLSDALRCLADYHEKEGLKNKYRTVEEGNNDCSWKDSWFKFVDHIKKDEGRSAMSVSITQLNYKTKYHDKLINFIKGEV